MSAVDNVHLGPYAEALKVMQEGTPVELLHKEDNFFKMITAKFGQGEITGKKIVMPLKESLGHYAVQSMEYNGAFPDRQRVVYDDLEAYGSYLGVTVEIDNVEAALSKGMGGFIDIASDEVESKNTALAQQMSRMVFGDGTGTLGISKTAYNTDAAASFDIVIGTAATDIGSVFHFEISDVVKFYPAASNTARTIGVGDTTLAKVIDVVPETNIVTFQPVDANLAAVNTLTAAIVSGDRILRSGVTSNYSWDTDNVSRDRASTELIGLDGIVSSNDGYLYGIDKAAVPFFKGIEKDCEGELLHVKHIISLAKSLSIRGAKPKILICSFDSYERLADLGMNMRSVITDASLDQTLGIETIRLAVPTGGTIPIVTSRYCPTNRIYVLDTDYFELRGNAPKFVSPDGQTLRLKPSSNGGFENKLVAYLHGMMSLICTKPSVQGKVVNFVNAE
jgi:hypothetical protein